MARRTLLLILMVVALTGLNLFQYLLRTSTASGDQASSPSASSAPGPKQQTPSGPTNAEALAHFYEIWTHNKNTVWTNRWLGIPTIQNPMDVWITQEIIVEIKPDFIVEAGTFHGGSAALWATILEQVNPNGRVITIDIEEKSAAARRLPIVKRKVDFVIGSSTAPEVVAKVTKKVEGGKVLVILDSLHTKKHVLNELYAYGPLVSVGSYIIVQDSFVNGHPLYPDWGPGPWEAIEAFLPSNDHFKMDKTRERLLFTYNPNGFLRRVR